MRSAVVVGAGVGGLAVAGALTRDGWQVTLLERGDRLRGDSAALLIWPNGLLALHALGLGGGLGAVASPAPVRGIRRPGGQWLVQPDDATGANREATVVVHREDLHDALVAGLGSRLDIRTGVSVRTVRCAPQERPAVGDGKHTWEADLVVAADGVDSVVRRRLAPESSVVAAGCAAWRAVIPWYRAPKLPEGGALGGETLGAGHSAGHRFRYALLGERGTNGTTNRGGIYWAATVPGAFRPEPAATQLGLLRRWFADWHAPIGDLLAATEPGDLIQHPVTELRPIPRSFSYLTGPGGFVLLGDAAHAMSHHLSQGACLALEDAATLRSVVHAAVPGRTLGDALTGYTRERRPRVVRIVRQSRRVGAVYSANSALMVRARDAALGLAPGRLLGRASAAARQWRPPA